MSRLILALALLSIALPAAANPGLGIIVGEPTGFSFKLWTDSGFALDGAAAWSFAGDPALHIHGDLLRHRYDLVEVDGDGLPLYYGIGARVKLIDGDDLVGIRVPLGLDYVFDDGRFDLFFELVPTMNVVPNTDFSLNAGLGFRYWLGRERR